MSSKRSPSQSRDANTSQNTSTSVSSSIRESIINIIQSRSINGNKSPISPSRLTRLQEKEEMQNLNDRLVIYIDTVRRLESENARLQTVVQSYNENSTRDVSEIKNLYERELEDAKRLIDELAKEKAKLEIELNKNKSQFDETQLKLNKKDKELKQVEAKLKTSESESLEFKSRYEQVQSEATRQKEELEKLRPHLTDLESQLSQIKKQLENETLLRVDLENKNQTLKEDLQFKSQIYDKEICQLRSSKRVEIEQVDVRLRDEYDSKLVNELQRIRDETELKIREMKDDVERRYQAKLNDAESLAKRSKQVTETLREEINSFKLKTAELQTEINSLQSRNTNNENRVKELEEKLRKANLKYEKDMLEKDNELNTARKEVQEVLTEYQELYDIKIALDMEIAAYRKLLESEEQRLNLSSSVHHQTSQLSSSYLDTSNVAAASTSTRGNRKRRMPSNVEIEVEQSSVELEQSQQTSCGVEIGKHDMDAKSVQLTNTTDKEINIGNWLIRRSADGKESEYKLPKSLVLKPAQTVTVWSSNSGKAHEPPNDLVMTQQNKWVVGDSMITILVDKDSNEQARRESKKLTDHKKLRQSTTTTPNKLSTSQQSTSSSAVSRLFGLWK